MPVFIQVFIIAVSISTEWVHRLHKLYVYPAHITRDTSQMGSRRRIAWVQVSSWMALQEQGCITGWPFLLSYQQW